MALSLSIDAGKGVTTTYHRIGVISTRYSEPDESGRAVVVTTVGVDSFVSKGVRDASLTNAFGRTAIIIPGDCELNAPRPWAYAWIKANIPAFAEAADV